MGLAEMGPSIKPRSFFQSGPRRWLAYRPPKGVETLEQASPFSGFDMENGGNVALQRLSARAPTYRPRILSVILAERKSLTLRVVPETFVTGAPEVGRGLLGHPAPGALSLGPLRRIHSNGLIPAALPQRRIIRNQPAGGLVSLVVPLYQPGRFQFAQRFL